MQSNVKRTGLPGQSSVQGKGADATASGGRALQLKQSMRGQAFDAQAAKLAPPSDGPGSTVQLKAAPAGQAVQRDEGSAAPKQWKVENPLSQANEVDSIETAALYENLESALKETLPQDFLGKPEIADWFANLGDWCDAGSWRERVKNGIATLPLRHSSEYWDASVFIKVKPEAAPFIGGKASVDVSQGRSDSNTQSRGGSSTQSDSESSSYGVQAGSGGHEGAPGAKASYGSSSTTGNSNTRDQRSDRTSGSSATKGARQTILFHGKVALNSTLDIKVKYKPSDGLFKSPLERLLEAESRKRNLTETRYNRVPMSVLVPEEYTIPVE